jgi:hypothetical protein
LLVYVLEVAAGLQVWHVNSWSTDCFVTFDSCLGLKYRQLGKPSFIQHLSLDAIQTLVVLWLCHLDFNVDKFDVALLGEGWVLRAVPVIKRADSIPVPSVIVFVVALDAAENLFVAWENPNEDRDD